MMAVALSILARREFRQGSAGILGLAAFPVVLLVPAIAAVSGTWAVLQGFRDVPSNGAEQRILEVSQHMLWGLWLAVAVALAAACAAGVLQRLGPTQPDASVEPSRLGSRGWLLFGMPLLALPVFLVVLFAADLPRFMIDGALRPLRFPEATPMRPGDLRAFSSDLSARLVAGTVGGLAVSALLSGAALIVFLVSRGPRPPNWLRRYSWFSLAFLIASLGWLVFRVTAEIDVVEQWAAGGSS
jgi:hypothetical protein